jgi:hypothetical protein
MPVPLDRYLDRTELEKRLYRDVADRLGPAIDAARISLVDDFCDGLFEVDATGEILASVGAERSIDRALNELYELQLNLEQRASINQATK